MLAAAATAEGTGLLCSLLLIATIIAFILGFCEALGITRFTGAGNTRFGTLVLAVILLVVYLVVC